MLRNRWFGSGEAVLRVARRKARRSGDIERTKQLNSILADSEMAAVAGVALEDEAGGGLFRDILAWIVANPEQFKEWIAFIISLFAEETK